MILLNTIVIIILLNWVGLIPYSLRILVYLWVRLLVSIIYWFIFTFSCLLKYSKFTLRHILPLGSPGFLWRFLVYLETIRFIIRPLTLSLRLSCNLIAGHVILFLRSNLYIVNYLILVSILIFELAVTIIQGCVYTLLNDIYFKEMSV